MEREMERDGEIYGEMERAGDNQFILLSTPLLMYRVQSNLTLAIGRN